jgi:hypothetical protein
VTPKELDIAIGELEERVDRLRALYEQYFMGFEKIEPGVVRKDVDRRFAALRKMQIRNTAQRFRLQTVTQKYNTYAMYWQRICRQIEEGTYKRHVQRAKQRFADEGAARPDAAVNVEIDELDLDDLDDAELDVLFAEAGAAVSAHASPRAAAPPAPGSQRQVPAVPPAPGSQRQVPAVPPAPGSQRQVPGGDGTSAPERPLRPAALPSGTGARPRIVVRKVTHDEGGPSAAGRAAGAPPPSSARIPGAAPSERLPAAPPAGQPGAPAASAPVRGPAPAPVRPPAPSAPHLLPPPSSRGPRPPAPGAPSANENAPARPRPPLPNVKKE